MSGGEGSVTCEEDGKWSAQSAFCVMTCPNPEIPDNSVPLAESNCIDSKRTFSPGVSCKFRCKPGYRVKDKDDPGRRILKKRCTKSGRWTQPKCEPIVCSELTPNLLMWYNCSDGNSLGSVCTNNCPGEEVCVMFLLFNSVIRVCLVYLLGQSLFSLYLLCLSLCFVFGITRHEMWSTHTLSCLIYYLVYLLLSSQLKLHSALTVSSLDSPSQVRRRWTMD